MTETGERYPVLIPAYKPTEKLIALCDRFVELGIQDVVIVDDGSGEQYQSIFEQIRERFPFHVIVHRTNQGKGRSLKDGFAYLMEDPNVKGCVTADADGQHKAEDIHRCLQQLQVDTGKMVMGVRDFSDKEIPLTYRVWNNMTKVIFSYIYGAKLPDCLCGLRGLPRSFMEKIANLPGERYEYETNVLIEATQTIGVLDIPIATIYDEKGHFTSRDSFRIYRIFLKVFLTFIFSSVSSTVIDLTLFHFSCNFLRDRFPLAYITYATIIARVVSAAYNYVVNKRVVFKDQTDHRHSGLKFLILSILHLAISAFAVTGLVTMIKGVPETLLKAVVDTTLFFINYPIQQKYVFGDKSEQ